MKILLSSHAFAPSIGGIETVSELLAEEFRRQDHEVKVVTQTAEETADRFEFEVVRRPSAAALFSLVKWCDVFWHNNLSLRTLWPALFLRKPVVLTHQGSYCIEPRGIDAGLRLKQAVANAVTGVAPSHAVASCFRRQSVVIPNPYDACTFTCKISPPQRLGELVFLGRLVSEKGLDLLLESLGRLQQKQIYPKLTIIGSGPEETALKKMGKDLELDQQLTFVGPKRGAELADLLNQHRIFVVPSRYDEPFGIVAVEGIACGCVVIGSAGGGLPEAIGPCGITFTNGDSAALADAIENLMAQPGRAEEFATNAPAHLAQFHPDVVAKAYLDLFRSKLQ